MLSHGTVSVNANVTIKALERAPPTGLEPVTYLFVTQLLYPLSYGAKNRNLC